MTQIDISTRGTQPAPDKGVPMLKDEGYAYFEGRIVPLGEAKVSIATHALSEDILEGITRNSLIELIRSDFGIPIEERRIDRTELYSAHEVFLCGTGVQVSPVASVDRRPVGNGQPGAFTMQLQERYLAACRGEVEKYRSWVVAIPSGGS